MAGMAYSDKNTSTSSIVYQTFFSAECGWRSSPTQGFSTNGGGGGEGEEEE